ncbi:MAG: hypothetical protein LUE17_03545, partial [Planctomycetaceae bacterium]|nr:hypothetical protein [Planctomycetaceae bacterium]
DWFLPAFYGYYWNKPKSEAFNLKRSKKSHAKHSTSQSRLPYRSAITTIQNLVLFNTDSAP